MNLGGVTEPVTKAREGFVMKKIALWGTIIIGFVAVISLVAAMNFGEKSKVYVSGEVLVPLEMKDKLKNFKTLYIVMFYEDAPAPMPYGAMKLRLDGQIEAGVGFPFFITKERLTLMRPDTMPPKKFRIKARFDRDGVAGPDQPGDLTGELSGIYLGTEGVTVKISKYIEAH